METSGATWLCFSTSRKDEHSEREAFTNQRNSAYSWEASPTCPIWAYKWQCLLQNMFPPPPDSPQLQPILLFVLCLSKRNFFEHESDDTTLRIIFQFFYLPSRYIYRNAYKTLLEEHRLKWSIICVISDMTNNCIFQSIWISCICLCCSASLCITCRFLNGLC